MNLLGREYRIYFVLSSHVCFLSGAPEGQWDAEKELEEGENIELWHK
jgi:hypothetical protein